MTANEGTKWTDSKEGKLLQERLASEKTLKAINHLLDRIDTLEQTVDRLTTVIEQGPGLLSMTADIADETYKKAAQKGINLEQRLGAALEIAEKLTAPAMVSQLNSVLEIANQAPGLVSMVADMADDAVKQAANKGVNIEERLGAALEIAEKLTAPAMVSQLNSVLEIANQAPGLVSMVADMADDAVKQAANKGVNIEERLGAALEIAEKLTAPAMVSQLNSVLEVANQAPGLVSMVADMADDAVKQAANKGVNIEERLGAALEDCRKANRSCNGFATEQCFGSCQSSTRFGQYGSGYGG